MNKFILVGLATTFMMSCNPSTQNKKEMGQKKTGLVEITTFKLNRGVAVSDFSQAARAMQKDFLEKQSGFIKRILTVSPDSIWTDIVFWEEKHNVEEAMKLADTSELVLPFIEKIDFYSVKMNLASPVLIEE